MEIKCPHCNAVFSLNESEADSIFSQLKTSAMEREIKKRISEYESHITDKHKQQTDIAVQKALHEQSEEVAKLKAQVESSQSILDETRQKYAAETKAEVQKEKLASEKRVDDTKTKYEKQIKQLQDELAYFRDLKAKSNIKLLGESLEQHCEMEFEKIHSYAFPNARFYKDNVVSKQSGSKGDYIYRETVDNIELLSIMFEMKNESGKAKTKKKNNAFFEELDKDRKEKNCEYAILVSLLEPDNDVYNGGIYQVPNYDKMYVIRPQCFITIIGILRNMAMTNLSTKQELALIRRQELDVMQFEENLMTFKNTFTSNYEAATVRFEAAIDTIDNAIRELQKTKENLLQSNNALQIATNAVNDVSIKRLCDGNQVMQDKFDTAHLDKDN